MDAGPQKSALSDPYDIGWIRVDDAGYTEDEAYAFLTGNASGVFTASANQAAHTGAMIALVPSLADLERLAVGGGEPLEELHLTLAYLGEADAIDDEMRAKIIAATTQYFNEPITTETFYSTAFNPTNPDMETALVLGVKGENLVGPRDNVMSAVRGLYSMPDNHSPWLPHVTLEYCDDVSRATKHVDKLGPITFDTLRFAFGGEVTDIPLTPDEHPLTAARWREDAHPRNAEGKFIGIGTPDRNAFSSRVREAKSGRSARNSAGSVKALSSNDKGRRAAAQAYETNSFKINSNLRIGGLEASGVTARQPLEDMMAESPLENDIVVTRGIRDPKTIFGSSWKTDGDNSGLRWRDPAFVSTTTSDSVSKFFSKNVSDKDEPVVMNILAPAGTEALKMDLGIAFGQKEVLLNRNLVFQIVNDHGKDGKGVRHIDVEVVPAP